MMNNQPERDSQFRILDMLLLIGGLSVALGILVPAGGPRLTDQAMMLAVVTVMMLAGSAIGYLVWRFCITTRFTVCLVNHAGYLLIAIIFTVIVNSRLLQEIPVFIAGPISFYGRLGRPPHVVSRFWDQLFLTGLITAGVVLLMSAHTFRRNWIGVILTSLGVAMWYLAGFYGVLARGP